MTFAAYLKSVERRFRRPFWLAAISACVVSISAVILLGLSGWFLTGAAIAGAAGPIIAQGFNYLLPSATIRLLAILRTVFRYGERLWGHEGGLMAMSRVRPHLFERLSKGHPKIILALGQGEASSRFVQDVTALENAMVAKSAVAYAVAGLIASVAMCAILSLQAALICAVGLAASMVIGWRLSQWLTHRQTDDEQTRLGELKQRVFEIAPLLPDMAAYNLDDAILSELAAHEDALMAAKTRTLSLESLLTVTSSALLALTLISVTLISGAKDLPGLALALLGITMGFESAGSLLHALSQQGRYRQAAQRVGELYETEVQVAPPAVSGDGLLDYKGQSVTFNTDLRLWISGASGAGKTRLIGALMELVEPADAPGLSAKSRFSRRLFSLCPQDAAHLSGTIRENLLMAVDAETMKTLSPAELETRLLTALEDAGLGERLKTLPKGPETWIGQGGVTLSGGERKRLGLARAYLRDAPILILDEPTEGLDATTEVFVVERLEARLQRTGQGLIFTSHRPHPRRLANAELKV